MARAAAVAVLLYAGTAALLGLKQRSLLYFPQGTLIDPAQTNFALQREGLTLRGWVMNPGKERALIYFGGNGDAVQTMRQDYAGMAPDRTVYLLAYRGYGASEGAPSEAALFGDALALYDEVHRSHADVAVVGRSLGSGVATWLASQRPLQKLVLVTPFDSIARLAQRRFPIFPAALLLRDKYESWRYAPAVHCPVLVIEAQNDEVVPADSTERLLQQFAPRPQLLRIDGVGHGSVVEDPRYAAAISSFLR
jgi:pimeloyl-ACP methyl ester carboxylesterase